MRPNAKLDAEFYRKVNQQLHTKDRMIRSLQQRLTEMQARVGSRAVDQAGNELEMELAELEAALQLTGPLEPPPMSHPEHDSALAMISEPPLPAPAPAVPVPHVPSPLAIAKPVVPAPAAPEAPELAPVASDALPARLVRKIAAVRPHLSDPTMDDSEVLHTALRLYDWFLKRHAQGWRVQLVNDADATTDVDLIL